MHKMQFQTDQWLQHETSYIEYDKNMGNTLELIGTDKRLSEQDSNTNSMDIETNN